MNRAERRNYIKRLNTPQKLEQYSAEIDRRLRREYEEKSDRKIREFIKCYTLIMAFILDTELETEKNIKISARKNKNFSKQLAKIDKQIMDDIQKHIKYIDDGTISIEDIEKYFREERDIDFNFV